jgi:hypothetical protein
MWLPVTRDAHLVTALADISSSVQTTASRPSVTLTRAERIGFWMYVAMGILCAAALVAAAMTAIVS